MCIGSSYDIGEGSESRKCSSLTVIYLFCTYASFTYGDDHDGLRANIAKKILIHKWEVQSLRGVSKKIFNVKFFILFRRKRVKNFGSCFRVNSIYSQLNSIIQIMLGSLINPLRELAMNKFMINGIDSKNF